MAAFAAVAKLIRNHKLVMFSKTTCPFCMKAKGTLKEAGVSDMKVVELDEVKNGDSLQNTLSFLTGHRTVPSVFIGGKFIGGGTETDALHQSGKLSEMLKIDEIT